MKIESYTHCVLSLIILVLCIIFIWGVTEEYSFFPTPNTPNITPDYNPFYPTFPPDKLDYVIDVPERYKTNASRSWISDAVEQCNSYSSGVVPMSVQDCPDSSFTFIDRPDYKGCIQLVQNTNYCMSDSYGNYKPNIAKLNVTSA